MSDPKKLIPLHDGYRRLKSLQVAQLAYDVIVHFDVCGCAGKQEPETPCP